MLPDMAIELAAAPLAALHTDVHDGLLSEVAHTQTLLVIAAAWPSERTGRQLSLGGIGLRHGALDWQETQ
jgi:hypothetical protein